MVASEKEEEMDWYPYFDVANPTHEMVGWPHVAHATAVGNDVALHASVNEARYLFVECWALAPDAKPKTFPADLFTSDKLNTVRLTGTVADDADFKFLRKCSARVLVANGMNLTPAHANELAAVLKSAPNLERVSLRDNPAMFPTKADAQTFSRGLEREKLTILEVDAPPDFNGNEPEPRTLSIPGRVNNAHVRVDYIPWSVNAEEAALLPELEGRLAGLKLCATCGKLKPR
jgi:hypothetical protein